MNKLYALACSIYFVTVITQLAQAADLQAGKQLVESTCVACHGTNGVSNISIYPNLCGQKFDYLVAQLKAFRGGRRINQIMSAIAENINDVDIDNVAFYYSNLKCP